MDGPLHPTMTPHVATLWSPYVDLLSVLLLVLLPLPSLAMTSSPSSTIVALWNHGDDGGTKDGCLHSESVDGVLTVRCSRMGLIQVPSGLPNQTGRLYLNNNQLTSLPADSFSGLTLLTELDLSNNQLSVLEVGCFRGLSSSLRFLDLSSNRLSTLDPAALGALRVHANLTHNPWHCDCKLQVAMPQLDLDPSSLAEVVCHTSDRHDLGIIGMPFVMLAEDWDLCLSLRRTTDVAMLVTMFLWFSMVISYLVYYVRHNQEDAQRHVEYLKSLPSRQA